MICLIGDFNCEPQESVIGGFMDSYNLPSLVKSPACFKSDSPRCIDLILTNRKRSFQNTVVIHTGLSDFHAMIVTVLKSGYWKKGPKRSLIIETTPSSVRRTSGMIFVIRFRLN